MILFFKGSIDKVYAVVTTKNIDQTAQNKLLWLFGDVECLAKKELTGFFIGSKKEVITPWSTNAVEITQNMGIDGLTRIEKFLEVSTADAKHDPMLEALYTRLDQTLFTVDKTPDPVIYIEDIASYNESEGLALSKEEIDYLENVSAKIERKLTDGEVFGFSQVNSEHCRHKIFNGKFIIDGQEKEKTLFELIKKTAKKHPNYIVSAYKDNVAFIEGSTIEQFAPKTQHTSDYFATKNINAILSLKAETHNFPTTVEPFNGAATGVGGEIRDRMAGGKGSLPLAGTAVYMTSYSRLEKNRPWENGMKERDWLYQTPMDILIKASNGASDFGNKFGQPLINGSVLTFEHQENEKSYGFDKVIMLAGGVGFAKKEDAQKHSPKKRDKVILLGGDNYKIGIGGGAVSSVATGEFGNSIEHNAIQRSNPEMQKRAMNVIRAMQESDQNPIVSIHDHGAGGHLNCLSELLEETGGVIDIHKLPVGDPTLSDKEIVSNESQERMGLIMKEKHIHLIEKVAQRERSAIYTIGEATGDMRFVFKNDKTKVNTIDWKLEHLFGASPKTVLEDISKKNVFSPISYQVENLQTYLEAVLQLEAVACKDWLTNKVDRSVTGKVATQQTCGQIQLPLNNLGVVALDYSGKKGVATSIGHAPIAGLVDSIASPQLSIAKALTNLVWASLTHGLKGVSLSANWMWPAKIKGENKRLYDAVQSASDFACSLGINIPTGKDSLSMTQKYTDGKVVYSPGTVIISAIAEVSNIKRTISPALISRENTSLLYIDFSQDEFHLGGTSFAQTLHKVGNQVPRIKDSSYFKNTFNTIQQLVKDRRILAGHDISAGGLITTLLEMCFPTPSIGLFIDLSQLDKDIIKVLFSEKPAVVVQVEDSSAIEALLKENQVRVIKIGKTIPLRTLEISHRSTLQKFDIDRLRDVWFKTSYLLDQKQSGRQLATSRFENYKKQRLEFSFPSKFTGKFSQFGIGKSQKGKSKIKAAIIREKGSNGDREMAYAMQLGGFEVKDVHMTDLISSREDLSDINFIVFVGGFSNSDVLGSAKGWAGVFLYHDKARTALNNFYQRKTTMSLGVCNGCQLMMELGLLYPSMKDKHPKMHHNESGKFESAFVNVNIPKNKSIMLSSLAGSQLGIWVAHGEGKFILPDPQDNYNISMTYHHSAYPGNPNGSDYGTAAVSSKDGRHLAMMPHLERTIFPWNWPHYPQDRVTDEISPWLEAFVNARYWIQKQKVR